MHNDAAPADATAPIAAAPQRNLLEEFDALKADVAAVKAFFTTPAGSQAVADVEGLANLKSDVELLKGSVGVVARTVGVSGLEEFAHFFGNLFHRK